MLFLPGPAVAPRADGQVRDNPTSTPHTAKSLAEKPPWKQQTPASQLHSCSSQALSRRQFWPGMRKAVSDTAAPSWRPNSPSQCCSKVFAAMKPKGNWDGRWILLKIGWAYAQTLQRKVFSPSWQGVREPAFSGLILPSPQLHLIVKWGLGEAHAFFQAPGDTFLILKFTVTGK